MTEDAIRQILSRYPQRRSALLPLLHLCQEEAGYLTEEALRRTAERLGLAATQVAEVASFYDMFRLKPGGRREIWVCQNLSCSLLGAEDVVRRFEEQLGVTAGETTPDGEFTLKRVECLAACDLAPVVQVGADYHGRIPPQGVEALLERLRGGKASEPLSTAGGRIGMKILTKRFEIPGYGGTIEEYLAAGGYQAIPLAFDEHTPASLIELVRRSGLRGRGGAGFPTGVKWGFVPKDPARTRYLVCNADESEPGTFKDRELITRDPHQLLEGIVLAGYAIDAHTAYVYLRGEFIEAAPIMERAIRDAYSRGFLGRDILGSGFHLDVHVHRGAGAYICGEETALLESLEGKRGLPRLKPPFPASAGLYRQPTVVNNVETLCNLPHIVLGGAEWYASVGTPRSTGTRIFSVSGHVRRPGNYELPIDVSMGELILEHAGGVREGRRLKAIIPGGSSVPVLTDRHLDTRMDFESLAKAGSMAGSGGVIVMDDTTCMVRVAEIVSRFYHHESCGQCTQCREGTAWLHKTLRRVEEGRGRKADLDLILDICRNMKGKTICPLSDAAAMPVESYLLYFGNEFDQHIAERACPFRSKGGS